MFEIMKKERKEEQKNMYKSLLEYNVEIYDVNW